MKKSEINKLDDKDLQLRYYLGGLKLINDGENQLCDYWTCDINCSCSAVPNDEKLVEVKKFINKHNLTNERFIAMSYWLLTSSVMKYDGSYSPIFIELEKVIMPYHFTHTKSRELPDNNFRERELENIADNPNVKEYCSKYQLDKTDFIILAKMSINYRFCILQIEKNPNDSFTHELYEIIDKQGLYVSREYIKEYRKNYKNYLLSIDAKIAQKRYLDLMKELQRKDSNLTMNMISEELSELGFNSKKDVNRLLLKK